MSSSHDEQPLTRRQLREMERQKPRKEREADAKAAEEAEAARKAEAEREAADAAAAGEAPAPAVEPGFSRRVRRQQGSAAADVPITTAMPVVVPAAVPVVDAAPETSAEAESGAPESDAAPESAAEPESAAAPEESTGSDAPTEPEAAAEPDASAESVPADHSDATAETVVPEIVSDEPVDDSEPQGSSEPIIDVVPLTEAVVVTGREPETAADDTAEQIEVVTVAETATSPDDEPEVVEQMVIDEPVDEAGDDDGDRAGDAPLAPRFDAPSDRAPQSAADAPSSFDDLLSLRNTAAMNSISTTSALVLPTVPGSNDVGTALDETGEVIITGSIDLPPSFGSLGAPASGLESNDLDSIIERAETDAAASDVAPVSAARAISTNTSSTSLIAPPKRARANAPVVLAVTAGVLAVGVVSLLLAVFVFRVF